MIPVSLRLKNFFSHKESDIDFSKFNSALLIGNKEGDYTKSNGSGKSAVFESILWCLFNKSRAAMMDDIVRWGENNCSVTFDFDHDGKRYRVVRKRVRNNSTSTVDFYFQNEFGEWQDYSGSTSGETNDKIEKTIKLDYKTFVNSVYFRQNDISEFAESEPSKKKEILKSIVDISRWDNYEKQAKEKAKEIRMECKLLQKSIEEYDEVFQKLSASEVEVSQLQEVRSEKCNSLAVLKEQIETLGNQYILLKKSLDTDSFDVAVSEIDKLRVFLRESSPVKERLTQSLARKREEVKALLLNKSREEQEIQGLEYQEIPEGVMDKLSADHTFYLSSFNTAKEMIKNLQEIKIQEGTCYVCQQSVSHDLHDKLHSDHLQKISEYESQTEIFKDKVAEIKKQAQHWKTIRQQNDLIDSKTASIKNLDYKITLVREAIASAETELEQISEKISSAENSLKANQEILTSIKNDDFQNLREKIKSLKNTLSDVEAEISEIDIKIGGLSERISLLREREEKMKKDKEEVNSKQESAVVFEKLAKFLGKTGIQTILLDAIIEDLEITSNKILNSICNEPSVIVLETQREGTDGNSIVETLDLKVRKDGHIQNFKSLSGGEKFRISLALRVALSDISSRYGGTSLEFLLLDEVNSPLDRFGVETLFVNVIKSLEEKYKILVITHDESLKEKFDNVINITKVNGESEIEFITR